MHVRISLRLSFIRLSVSFILEKEIGEDFARHKNVIAKSRDRKKQTLGTSKVGSRHRHKES